MKPSKKSLKKGSVYCKECDGTGLIELTYNQAYGISDGPNLKNIVCTYCDGSGQLDRIEAVVGKNRTHKLGFFPDGDIVCMYV